MKIETIKQPNFKSVYIEDERLNKRERMLADDISGKLLGKYPSFDTKVRNWNKWLKDEKGIDILVKRTKDTQD